MKVRCVDPSYRNLTKGMVYEVQNKICKEDTTGYYVINDLGELEWFFKERFEEVKEMTKDDLKTGMVVEIRNRKRYMVVGNMFLAERTNLLLDQFEDNLICNKYDPMFDILKIYEGSEKLKAFDELNDDRKEVLTLLWERVEKSPIQLEIEKLEAEKKQFDQNFKKRMEELKAKA